MASSFILPEFPGIKFPWFGRLAIAQWKILKQFVYQRDQGICQWPGGCGPVAYEESHCHHVLELSESGTNHPTNLKTLCHKHHKVRHPFMKTACEKLREWDEIIKAAKNIDEVITAFDARPWKDVRADLVRRGLLDK